MVKNRHWRNALTMANKKTIVPPPPPANAAVPPEPSPPPSLASRSFLPSTPTTWAASAWPRPPSLGWRTNLASTFPSSSPLAWPPFITLSRPPHQLRPSRGSDAAHLSSILLHQEPVTRIDTWLSQALQTVGPISMKDNQCQPVALPHSLPSVRVRPACRPADDGAGELAVTAAAGAARCSAVLYLRWLRAPGISVSRILFFNVCSKQSCNTPYLSLMSSR